MQSECKGQTLLRDCQPVTAFTPHFRLKRAEAGWERACSLAMARCQLSAILGSQTDRD